MRATIPLLLSLAVSTTPSVVQAQYATRRGRLSGISWRDPSSSVGSRAHGETEVSLGAIRLALFG